MFAKNAVMNMIICIQFKLFLRSV